eukprot:SAG31_NODE_4053_length_3633_cov_12.857951_2_plen_924_part_00
MPLEQGLVGQPGGAEPSHPLSLIVNRLAALEPEQRKLISIAALSVNAVAFLVMALSLRGAYHLSGEDAEYGNNCGASPPSYSFLHRYVDVSERQSVQAAAANASSDESPSAGKVNREDGETCGSGNQCLSGICVGTTCVLSDYNRIDSLYGGYPRSTFGQTSAFWGLLEYDMACFLFLLLVAIVLAHRPSFAGSWKIACLLIVFGGLIGIAPDTDSSYVRTELLSAPAMTAGFALIIFYGGVHIYALIAIGTFASVVAIAGTDLETIPPAAELLPILAAFFLAAFLLASLTAGFCKAHCCCCNDDGNWDRASFAMQRLASTDSPMQIIFKAVSFCSLLGVSSIVYKFFTYTRSAYLLGAMLDCSDYSVPELRGFMASCATKYMCHTYPPTTETCAAHDSAYMREVDFVHTGMYALEDPLARSFIWMFRLYNFGLVLLAIGSILSMLGAEPGLRTATVAARNDKILFHKNNYTWNMLLLGTAAASVLPLLFMAIGANGMFNLDVDDLLYGNGAGGIPPLGPLADLAHHGIVVDPDSLADAMNPALNISLDPRKNSSHPAAGAANDGSACESNIDCVSNICVAKDSTRPEEMVCVLQEFWPEYNFTAANFNRDAMAAPYWHPLYAGLGVIASSLVPIELAGPTFSCVSGCASVAVALHAWVNWAGAIEYLEYSSVSSMHSFRQVYNSIVDCSGFSDKEMSGAAEVSGYYCYDGPEDWVPIAAPPWWSTCTPESSCEYGNYGSRGCRARSSFDCHDDDSSCGNSWEDGEYKCVNNQCYENCYQAGSTPPPPSQMMDSTLNGIKSASRRNPLLASWMHSNIFYLLGLFFFVISSLATLLFAFPVTGREVLAASDYVMCCGVCARTFGIETVVDKTEAADSANPIVPTQPQEPFGAASTPSPMAKACPQCGTQNDVAAVFCKECGDRI